MFGRCWMVVALGLVVGATGCTGPAKRLAGPLPTGPSSWAEDPAPVQRPVSLPPEPVASTGEGGAPTGLSRYFPGLRRASAESPRMAASPSRASWFSLGRRPKAPQVYTTDARPGLSPGLAESAVLPVALQVPTDRPTDPAVSPARAEQAVPAGDPLATSDSAPPEKPTAVPTPTQGEPLLTDFLGSPATPTPAEKVASPDGPRSEVAARMPELPAIDPRERPRMAAPPAPTPARDNSIGAPWPKADDQARKAVPAASGSTTGAEEAEPTILAAFLHRIVSPKRSTPHVHSTGALASPQSMPSPQSSPRPVAKPSPQMAPSPQAKASSQAGPSTHDCVCENCGAKIGKKPCLLKRLKKKMFAGETEAVAAPSPQMP